MGKNKVLHYFLEVSLSLSIFGLIKNNKLNPKRAFLIKELFLIPDCPGWIVGIPVFYYFTTHDVRQIKNAPPLLTSNDA